MNKIDHPAYYGGKGNRFEAIKIIQAWKLNFCLGNVIKYTLRAGRKSPDTKLEDLAKAAMYLAWEIAEIKKEES